MSDRQQDTDLRARFLAQRHADAREAPSFAVMMTRARAAAAQAGPARAAHRRALRRLVYVGGIAAAAIGGLLIVPRSPSTEEEFEQTVRAFQTNPALGAWQSPTDGLLRVPGSQLISTVPSVGTQ